MHSPENNVTYNNVDTYVLEHIPGFSDFFYQIYDDSDRELKFEVFGSLTEFFREFYKKNDQIMVNMIVYTLYKLYLLEDKKIKDLILTGFIENLLEEDEEKMIHLRNTLKYPELQKCLDDTYYGWYEINLEKLTNNYHD